MKRIFYLFLLLSTTLGASAQTEGVTISFDGPARPKDFGGFILDMGTMLNAESLTIPTMMFPTSLLAPWAPATTPFQVNPEALKINKGVIYSGGVSTGYSGSNILSVLHPGFGNGPVTWQSASYRLNNGVRINTYGEYDADGYKRRNPTALPWQRNNFNAAFEVKSPDGKFGVKLEVTGGRNGY